MWLSAADVDFDNASRKSIASACTLCPETHEKNVKNCSRRLKRIEQWTNFMLASKQINGQSTQALGTRLNRSDFLFSVPSKFSTIKVAIGLSLPKDWYDHVAGSSEILKKLFCFKNFSVQGSSLVLDSLWQRGEPKCSCSSHQSKLYLNLNGITRSVWMNIVEIDSQVCLLLWSLFYIFINGCKNDGGIIYFWKFIVFSTFAVETHLTVENDFIR